LPADEAARIIVDEFGFPGIDVIVRNWEFLKPVELPMHIHLSQGRHVKGKRRIEYLSEKILI
jgi:hypothetical protein